jgi:iron uptake system EfeUOB component EfeO/EfeM
VPEGAQDAGGAADSQKDAVKEDTEEVLMPSAQQETNAWEVIKNWTDVAEERRNRGPNLSYYSAENDECISTNSLLTYSVTEAPSTGGLSNRYVLHKTILAFS